MSSETVATLVKLIESLPEPAQDRVVEHLREYIQELQDELEWDDLFVRTQDHLIAAARQAKKEIAEGKSKPMDYDRL